MNRKVLSKLLIVILLLVMVINNISYAVNITKEDFKISLHKIFGSDIEIETIFKVKIEAGEGVTIEGGGATSTSKVTYEAPEEVTITDSQIILKEIEEGQETLIKIDYIFENNRCEFSINSGLKDFGMDENDAQGNVFLLLAIAMMHSEATANSFMAVADSLGIDLNLAHSYYSQVISFQEDAEADQSGKTTQVVEDDIFNYTLSYDENTMNVQSSIQIDMDKLSKLDNSYLNGDAKSTVKLLNTPNLDDEKPVENNTNNENNSNNNVANNSVNNIVNNTVTNVVNNTSKNTTNNVINNTTNKVVNNTTDKAKNVVNNTANKAIDNTTSNKIIPAAGSETAYFIVLSMVVISLLIYIKLRKYDDVK